MVDRYPLDVFSRRNLSHISLPCSCPPPWPPDLLHSDMGKLPTELSERADRGRTHCDARAQAAHVHLIRKSEDSSIGCHVEGTCRGLSVGLTPGVVPNILENCHEAAGLDMRHVPADFLSSPRRAQTLRNFPPKTTQVRSIRLRVANGLSTSPSRVARFRRTNELMPPFGGKLVDRRDREGELSSRTRATP